MLEQTAHLSMLVVENQQTRKSIADHVIALLVEGQYHQCLAFLSVQSEEIVDSSVELLVYRAAAMLFSEKSQISIEIVLSKAEGLDSSGEMAGGILTIRAMISSYTDNPENGIRLSKKALQNLDHTQTYFRNLNERNLGIAYTLKNDLHNASHWFESLLMSSYALSDWGGVLAAYNYLTYIRKVQGRLRDAEVIYQKALQFIETFGLYHIPHSIKIISGYGQLLLHWNRIDEAKDYFLKAIHLGAESDPLYACTAYQNLCEALIRQNNHKAAHNVLKQLQVHAENQPGLYAKIHFRITQALQTRASIEAGHLQDGIDWLKINGFEDIPPCQLHETYGYEVGLMLPVAVRIYLLMGMHNKAISIVKGVIPNLIHQGAHSYLIRALCALAIAHDQAEQSQLAFIAIKKAIDLGAPEANIGDFLYFGQSLLPVLYQVIDQGLTSIFLLEVIKQLQTFKPLFYNALTNTKYLVCLSQREVTVLELIAQGMTDQEIAKALFLSYNTIKSHRKNIYRKLAVKNRSQAASHARIIGILSPKHPYQSMDRVT
jgi:LuxR family transcriptional regulator, maltose regulon positive regulatory protein